MHLRRQLLSAFCMNPNTHRTKGFAGLSVRHPHVQTSSRLSAAPPFTVDNAVADDAFITITITDKPDTFKAFMQVLHCDHIQASTLRYTTTLPVSPSPFAQRLKREAGVTKQLFEVRTFAARVNSWRYVGGEALL